MTGILFLLPRFRPSASKWDGRVLLIACSSLVVEMLVAVYVHLQPRVPPEVLSLGIKPPVTPLFVLLLDVMVVISAWKDSQSESEFRGTIGPSVQDAVPLKKKRVSVGRITSALRNVRRVCPWAI